MLGHRNFCFRPSAIGIALVRCVVLRVLARGGLARAADCMIDPFVALRSAMLRDVQPLPPTLPQLGRARCGIVRHQRCPQSPRAALNAFGLFAAGASGRARPHTCQGWRPPAFRRRSPLRSRAIYLRHVENAGRTTARVLMASCGRGASRRGYERGYFSILRASHSGASGAPPGF